MDTLEKFTYLIYLNDEDPAHVYRLQASAVVIMPSAARAYLKVVSAFENGRDTPQLDSRDLCAHLQMAAIVHYDEYNERPY